MSSASFTSLLSSDLQSTTSSAVSRGLGDRIAERTGSGVPKFKSLPPPSFPPTPPSAASPTSWFAISPGISPAELLDSPILLSASTVLPSPTTGTFPIQGFGWNNNSYRNQQKDVKIELNNFSEFSFQTQKPFPSYDLGGERWKYQEPANLSDKSSMKSEVNQMQSYSAAIQRNDQSCYQSSQAVREKRKSDDGYNWRKYGQKQVKGSENPRSYYKCTYSNCSVKKKVETSIDGQITEIVYKGSHNHPKPQPTRRSSSSSAVNQSYAAAHFTDQSEKMDSTPENSTISIADDEFEQSSHRSRSEIDEEEPDLKRWKGGSESECVSAVGSRAVREPRVVVQTTSDIDILDDGYRWRKYGQKVVKGNPNPRSYYKCTTPGCPVRKHVERASHDPRSVITTYEGKHNHDIPAARGSQVRSSSSNNAATMAIRPNNLSYTIPVSRLGQPTLEPQRSFHTPESFGYYGNSVSYDAPFSRAKDEPQDDLFLESLLS